MSLLLSATRAPSSPLPRLLTPRQLAAAQTVMQLFVDEDLAHGVSPQRQLYCAACQTGRPMPGFIQYGDYQLCNGCATEYEVARMRGVTESAGQYVWDKRFGDGDQHALAALALAERVPTRN